MHIIGGASAAVSREELLAPWSSVELFKHLKASDILINKEDRENLRPMFWRSICSEHDARHFYKYLAKKRTAIPWEFDDFLAYWLLDEVNHARGFKILYHHIYGESFDEIEAALRNRVNDFTHLDEFFNDFTSVCLLFSFDELVTTQTYRASISFYESLGFAGASEWGHRLVFDESRHCTSALKIAAKYCSNDYSRFRELLTRIIDVDLQQETYHGTFVLDHSCPEFPFDRTELETMCERAILRRLDPTRQNAAPEDFSI